MEGRLQNLKEIISYEMFKSKYHIKQCLTGILVMFLPSGNNNMHLHKRVLDIQLLLISFLTRVELFLRSGTISLL